MIDLALDDRLFIMTDLDCALQELDLLLNTENTELLGDVNYGVELEHFLWCLTPTTESLQEYIEDKINTQTIYAKKFNPTINCQYLEGSERSIYYVSISLFVNDNLVGKRNYRFQ